MRSLPTVTAAVLLVLGMITDWVRADDPLTAHRIVAIKSVDGMPADIAPLFRRYSREFERHVLVPGVEWPGDRKLRRRNDWHHVQVDVEAEHQVRPERMRAFGAFPHDESVAARLSRHRGYQNGGRLPWAIEECYQRLLEAFKSAGPLEVMVRAGHLAHFAADAVNPFRSSVNGDGSATENPRFGSQRGVHPQNMGHSVRGRFGAGLVARYENDYADALNLSTADYQPVRDPAASAFEVIEGSLSVLDEVAQADREVLTQLEIVDRGSFEAHQEAYYAAMDKRCRGLSIGRLQAGAVFTANLVGGAWQAAGEPSAESILARSDGEGDPAPVTATNTGNRYVGSRHSNVFHKPTCRFAKQISQDNLVTFATSLEARRANRRACKACKPR